MRDSFIDKIDLVHYITLECVIVPLCYIERKGVFNRVYTPLALSLSSAHNIEHMQLKRQTGFIWKYRSCYTRADVFWKLGHFEYIYDIYI